MEEERRQIYLDNGSTSFPKAPGVPEAVAAFLRDGAFNISRGGYAGAYETEALVLDTRERLARLFGCGDSRRVIFTPGITWSLNFFLNGFLKPGDHILVTGLEHNALMRPLERMKKQGIRYHVIPTERDGTVRTDQIEGLLQPETRAIAAVHASNVCGTVVDLEEIGEICRRHGLVFAVDTAQSAGTLDVTMERWHIDFLAFTGHKGLLGPQGIGGFLLSEQLNDQMEPLIAGGTGSRSDSLEQPDILPDKFESGTMNLPGIAGLHAALAYLESTGIKLLRRKKKELTAQFLEQVKDIPGIRIVGKQGGEDRTSVVSLDFTGRDNAIAAFELEQNYGIMTRVGLHCAPLAHQTLGTMPRGTVRFAFSAFNTAEEIAVCTLGIREIAGL